MKTSLTLSGKAVQERLDAGEDHVIRLLVPENQTVAIEDEIRGTVEFDTAVLDDKVLLKTDGMPTYHLANIVDDHLMKITHVVRGEEWLSSTAHHILLYRAFGWTPPVFAHLPLILKPSGKGKLSKRDGKKLGIPVFPLSWEGETEEDSFEGFREYGFLPEAVINILAMLGWNPGTEQELFSLDELVRAFELEAVGKSGARFDYEKAKWYNQQYIMDTPDEVLAQLLANEEDIEADIDYMTAVAGLLKERVHLLTEFQAEGDFLFGSPTYDEKAARKKVDRDMYPHYLAIIELIKQNGVDDPAALEGHIRSYIETNELKFGKIFPALRIGLTGGMKGPDLYALMRVLGTEESLSRLTNFFDQYASSDM